MSGSKRGAFTLVELLVVISIIMVLIAILLPALNRANEAAKTLKCLSNLRQMTQSAANYVAENQGYYPSGYYTIYPSDPAGTTYAYSWDFTTITTGAGAVSVVPGLLWHTGDPSEILQCPSYEGPSNSTADPFTGYNYNVSYVGHGDMELPTPIPAKAVQILRSSQVAIFGDGQYSGGADKYMRAPLSAGAPFSDPGDWESFPDPYRYSGTQGYRHLGRTNVAYCDGHAESQLDLFTGDPTYAAQVIAGTGFLSVDNSAYGAQ